MLDHRDYNTSRGRQKPATLASKGIPFHNIRDLLKTTNPNPACEESFWHLCAFDFSLRSFRDSLAVRTCRARAPLVVLIGVGGQIKLLPLYVSMNTHAAGNTGFERTDAGKSTCGRKDLHPRVQEAAGTRPASSSSVQQPAYPSFFRARTLEVQISTLWGDAGHVGLGPLLVFDLPRHHAGPHGASRPAMLTQAHLIRPNAEKPNRTSCGSS